MRNHLIEYNVFKVAYNEQTLVGDYLAAVDSQCELVCLHGAGKAQRSRFTKLREQLALDGISTLAFDFMGHGDSSGLLEKDSLHSRTNQVVEVIRHHRENIPHKNRSNEQETSLFSLLATSMSAYTAIKLTELIDVKNLILVVPAIYHHQAYDVAFDSGFSDIIRKSNSWVNTDAWSLLEKFEGNLSVITAEKDKVIPSSIPDMIADLAIHANSKTTLEISGSSHQIMDHINKNTQALTKLADNIKECLLMK